MYFESIQSVFQNKKITKNDYLYRRYIQNRMITLERARTTLTVEQTDLLDALGDILGAP